VHYSAATQMSYWRKGEALPARLVQFTSSGMKNVMPEYITAIDHSLSFAQQLVRTDIGGDRLAWEAGAADAIAYPPGRNEGDVPPVLRKRLRRKPALLPIYGWPVNRRDDPEPDEFSRVKADDKPDWSWRLRPVFDLRPDNERPPMARPVDLGAAPPIDAQIATAGDPVRAYQRIAARQQTQLDRLGNSRQILFRSNIALVRFERRGEALDAVHELYSVLPDPASPTNEIPGPELFVLQRASLTPAPEEVRPEDEPLKGGLTETFFSPEY
jgi:hypothetical protein